MVAGDFCSNCGTKTTGVKFCSSCGAPVSQLSVPISITPWPVIAVDPVQEPNSPPPYFSEIELPGQIPRTQFSDQTSQDISKTFMLVPEYSHCQASSVWQDNPIGQAHGQGRLDSPQAWSACINVQDQWWQFDLGAECSVSGVVTQGRGGSATTQRVTSYTVQTSVDEFNWYPVDGGKTFSGNPNSMPCDQKVTHEFDSCVNARFVRFIVKTWDGHISMRSAVLVKSSKSIGRGFEANHGHWVKLADEGQTVTVPPNSHVRYGAGDNWAERVMAGTFRADNSTFGDPIYGVSKRIELYKSGDLVVGALCVEMPESDAPPTQSMLDKHPDDGYDSDDSDLDMDDLKKIGKCLCKPHKRKSEKEEGGCLVFQFGAPCWCVKHSCESDFWRLCCPVAAVLDCSVCAWSVHPCCCFFGACSLVDIAPFLQLPKQYKPKKCKKDGCATVLWKESLGYSLACHNTVLNGIALVGALCCICMKK